jgi:hypothetical protein
MRLPEKRSSKIHDFQTARLLPVTDKREVAVFGLVGLQVPAEFSNRFGIV